MTFPSATSRGGQLLAASVAKYLLMKLRNHGSKYQGPGATQTGGAAPRAVEMSARATQRELFFGKGHVSFVPIDQGEGAVYQKRGQLLCLSEFVNSKNSPWRVSNSYERLWTITWLSAS